MTRGAPNLKGKKESLGSKDLSNYDLSESSDLMQLHEVPIKTALNLLTIYGDTVEKHAKSALSLKQKAIYTYLRMVLQPIWLLNVTSY